MAPDPQGAGPSPYLEVRAISTHNGNGHRRRNIRKLVLAEEDHCGVCGQPVDKTLDQVHGPDCDGTHKGNRVGCRPDPRGPVVDEIIPRIKGGSPYRRDNTMLAHRECNELKGDRTLEWASAEVQRRKRSHMRAQVTMLVCW